MKTVVITSFSAKNWSEYAERFVRSFVEHWPKDVGLIVYFEPDQPATDFGTDLNVLWRPISEVAGLQAYLAAIGYFPLLNGFLHTPNDVGQTVTQYNIQFDARMGRKTFIQRHAVLSEKFDRPVGRIIWVDADVVTHAPVTHEWINSIFPIDKFCVYLGREKMYTESGFLGFNPSHRLAPDFFEHYVSVFKSGVIFLQPAWHDCIAFDIARRAYQKQWPEEFVDLGAGIDPGPGLQVFINSRLGETMDHLKGARKPLARSPDSDLTVERSEDHWAT